MNSYQSKDGQSSNYRPKCVSYKLNEEPSIYIATTKRMHFHTWILVFLKFHQFKVKLNFPIGDVILLSFLSVSHMVISGALEFNWSGYLKTHPCHFSFSMVYIEIF